MWWEGGGGGGGGVGTCVCVHMYLCTLPNPAEWFLPSPPLPPSSPPLPSLPPPLLQTHPPSCLALCLCVSRSHIRHRGLRRPVQAENSRAIRPGGPEVGEAGRHERVPSWLRLRRSVTAAKLIALCDNWIPSLPLTSVPLTFLIAALHSGTH